MGSVSEFIGSDPPHHNSTLILAPNAYIVDTLPYNKAYFPQQDGEIFAFQLFLASVMASVSHPFYLIHHSQVESSGAMALGVLVEGH